MHPENAAFETLWHPFLLGTIAWRERYLFLRARAGPMPSAISANQLDCVQSFKPFNDQLVTMGVSVIEKIEAAYPVILLLPPPQRDEARALFALALQHLTDDGLLVVSMQNTSGAKSGENDLRKLSPGVQSLSKNKCRVFWTGRKNIDEVHMQSWLNGDAAGMVEKTGFISRPGIFAWDRIDAASKLLADNLPDSLVGCGADLGAGLGYLAHSVLSRCESVKAMDIFEAEARALDCARLNLVKFENRAQLKYHWHDVAQGVKGPYDFVISNPPFHQGSEEVQALGQAFIRAAANSLRPGGFFYMVANRHLPYEAVLSSHFSRAKVLAAQDGYKVFEAIKAAQ